MTANRARLLEAFAARFRRGAEVIAEAPGRVNLIGEHTDYNQGHVLPIAIDRTVAVAAAPRPDGVVRAFSLEFDETQEFEPPVSGPAAGGWREYVRGVAWALSGAGHPLHGADMAITGDVPIGAGLSSSAALEVAAAAALAAVSGLRIEALELALLAQRAENDFVGVQCGAMDQLAAALGRRDHALLIDCRSLAVEPVPLGLDEAGAAVVAVDSGVRRALGEAPYNRRRQECAEAARRLGVPALRDVDAAALQAARAGLPEHLYRRARHVVSEEARVLAAVEALRTGDLEALGELLYESHRSLQDDFAVSCRELDLLVELAQRTPGVLGARLTGAGFGGCTVNLVRAEALDLFRASVVEEYRTRTGRCPAVHVCRTVDGLAVSRV